MPFGFHLTMDTLPSGVPQSAGFRSALACFRLSPSCPFRFLHTFRSPRPARHYPRFRIRRPSSERRRDFNPPELRAAQRTLWAPPTPGARHAPCLPCVFGLPTPRAARSPMLRIVLCTHAAPNTPVDRWRALVDSLAHLLDGFPRIWDGSASTTPLSGPAQASLALRPACLLDLLSGPLSQGFAVAVARLPSSGFSAPDSYRGVSTELLGRDFHPLERCTFMAHPDLRTWSDYVVIHFQSARRGCTVKFGRKPRNWPPNRPKSRITQYSDQGAKQLCIYPCIINGLRDGRPIPCPEVLVRHEGAPF